MGRWVVGFETRLKSDVPVVPASGKGQAGVDEALDQVRQGHSANGHVGSHFSEIHGEDPDEDGHDEVGHEEGSRAGGSQDGAGADEETCADGAACKITCQQIRRYMGENTCLSYREQ